MTDKASEERLQALLAALRPPLTPVRARAAACRNPDATDEAAYRARVASFRIATWFAKPPTLSPLQCARYGWRNSGVDELTCVSCGAVATAAGTISTTPSATTLPETDTGDSSADALLVTAHRAQCRWRFCPTPLALAQPAPRTAAELRTALAALRGAAPPALLARLPLVTRFLEAHAHDTRLATALASTLLGPRTEGEGEGEGEGAWPLDAEETMRRVLLLYGWAVVPAAGRQDDAGEGASEKEEEERRRRVAAMTPGSRGAAEVARSVDLRCELCQRRVSPFLVLTAHRHALEMEQREKEQQRALEERLCAAHAEDAADKCAEKEDEKEKKGEQGDESNSVVHKEKKDEESEESEETTKDCEKEEEEEEHKNEEEKEEDEEHENEEEKEEEHKEEANEGLFGGSSNSGGERNTSAFGLALGSILDEKSSESEKDEAMDEEEENHAEESEEEHEENEESDEHHEDEDEEEEYEEEYEDEDSYESEDEKKHGHSGNSLEEAIDLCDSDEDEKEDKNELEDCSDDDNGEQNEEESEEDDNEDEDDENNDEDEDAMEDDKEEEEDEEDEEEEGHASEDDEQIEKDKEHEEEHEEKNEEDEEENGEQPAKKQRTEEQPSESASPSSPETAQEGTAQEQHEEQPAPATPKKTEEEKPAPPLPPSSPFVNAVQLRSCAGFDPEADHRWFCPMVRGVDAAHEALSQQAVDMLCSAGDPDASAAPLMDNLMALWKMINHHV